jgi:DNA polymerase III delta prime subunit
MEKLPDGKCIFRNPRCEERVAKKFEDNVQKKREKIIAQVEMEIDKEELQTTIGVF